MPAKGKTRRAIAERKRRKVQQLQKQLAHARAKESGTDPSSKHKQLMAARDKARSEFYNRQLFSFGWLGIAWLRQVDVIRSDREQRKANNKAFHYRTRNHFTFYCSSEDIRIYGNVFAKPERRAQASTAIFGKVSGRKVEHTGSGDYANVIENNSPMGLHEDYKVYKQPASAQAFNLGKATDEIVVTLDDRIAIYLIKLNAVYNIGT